MDVAQEEVCVSTHLFSWFLTEPALTESIAVASYAEAV